MNKIAPITVLKPGDRPAGGVTTFVRNVVREIVQGRDRNVPCDGCTSCRRAPSLHVDHLTEEEIRTLRAVRHPDIGIVLEKNPDGSWGQSIPAAQGKEEGRPINDQPPSNRTLRSPWKSNAASLSKNVHNMSSYSTSVNRNIGSGAHHAAGVRKTIPAQSRLMIAVHAGSVTVVIRLDTSEETMWLRLLLELSSTIHRIAILHLLRSCFCKQRKSLAKGQPGSICSPADVLFRLLVVI